MNTILHGEVFSSRTGLGKLTKSRSGPWKGDGNGTLSSFRWETGVLGSNSTYDDSRNFLSSDAATSSILATSVDAGLEYDNPKKDCGLNTII